VIFGVFYLLLLVAYEIYWQNVCRAAEETKTCVGQVQYFVKAAPCSDDATAALRQLGLPTAVQRFAIVDAYRATNAQSGLEVTGKEKWFKAVSQALCSAGLLQTLDCFAALLQEVRDWSMVLAVGEDARVKLTRRTATSGTLMRLAIPLSSKYAEWYSKEEAVSNWSVHPLVRIDPRRAPIGSLDLPAGGGKRRPMESAIQRIVDAKLYFVHTWSMSNSKMWKLQVL
jgi:hypothetical protein